MFKKSEHVGNKSDFPELGGDFIKQQYQAQQEQPKQSVVSSVPAKQSERPTFKKQDNKFGRLREEEEK